MIRLPSTRTPGIWRQNSSNTFSGGGSFQKPAVATECRPQAARRSLIWRTESTLSIAFGNPCR